MPVRVSVLLPTNNAAATVVRAVASIQAQTCRDWELLVLDDGSTDATADLVAAITRTDERIRLIVRPHEGIVAALEAGLAAAVAPIIARMDADDESYPDRFAAQLRLLECDGTPGLVSSLVDFGGDRVANAGYALHVDWMNSVVTPSDIRLNRFVESPLAHPSVMFRRELVARHGGYRAGDFPEDYELWLRWLDAGVVMAKVPRPLLRWNDPPARLSRTDPRYDPDKFFRTKARWIACELSRVGGGRPVWVWGAGRPTRKRAAYLQAEGVRFAGFIDIDAKKIGGRVGALSVISAAQLPPPAEAFVVGYVSARGARDLIRGALRAAGYTEGADFLMCA